MVFGPEKLQAAGGDIFKETASLRSQLHAGFAADEKAAAQVRFQLMDDAGHGRLAGV